jgi:putative tricarboxylic transport membrane protein
MRRSGAELTLSIGVLAIGVGAAFETARLPAAGGYSGIGPNFIPGLVSGLLILLGVWLALETLTGGWRSAAPDEAAARGEHPFDLRAFAWVSAGLFAQMLLVGNAGFVLAATGLFVCVGRGFGSVRYARDAAIGLVLSIAIYLFFVKLLNVGLPAGWLAPLLGTAGT